MATHATKTEFNRHGLELHEFTDELDCPICHEPCDAQKAIEKAYMVKLSELDSESNLNPLKICYYQHHAVRIKHCGHIFGMQCLQTWLSDHRTCPMCRQELFPALTDKVRWRDLFSRSPVAFDTEDAFADLKRDWAPAEIIHLHQLLDSSQERYEAEMREMAEQIGVVRVLDTD
jgi:hypothetical protein